ncbi:hypothetical protein LP579_22050, partial [Escherichia coli]|nr:hypothetical protein [Escherichia coli]
KRAYCLKTQPATGETYPKSDLFNKAIPLVEPVIRRTLGIIRRKDAVLSPAAERFFALLINLWTDDKDNLWTNIVERQRHALQEIG